MEIFVNGEPVSFSLEKENSLFEVFTALSGWADNQAVRLTGLEVDGAALEISHSADWGERPLEGIRKINIQAAATQRVEELGIMRDYFELFAKALENDNDQTLREILA
ncbi:MAG: hypothetical protein FWG35_06645, partial [Spirochaetaceae bacterium]|nr:hypothetical protein [Spirochaetaceae bacterium]